MNHRLVQTFSASVLSMLLLYYSVAWAVLRCVHDEDRVVTETSVSVAGLHQSDFLTSPLIHPDADIECMGLTYHTETLARPSGLRQLTFLSADITSRANGLLILHDVAEPATKNLWRSALFDHSSTLLFPTHTPRYLSLSVLRI